MAEKWVAFTRGMPSSISEEEYDVAVLGVEDSAGNTLLDPESIGAEGEMRSHFYYFTSLTHILADIQRTYYTVKAVARTSTDLEYSLDAARSPRARLKDWRDQLPESLKRAPHVAVPPTTAPARYPQDLDGSGSLYLSYIVTHMSLFRALLRPLDAVPSLILQCKGSAKAVIKGGLLCVKEFVEFVESLTGAQWNSFWHSCMCLPCLVGSSLHSAWNY
jgi:hypothetical protein